MLLSAPSLPMGRSRRLELFPYAVLIVAVIAAYSNIFNNAFLYDDETLITHNQFLREWHYLPTLFTTFLSAGSNATSTYYRPLQSLLYMIVFQLNGLSTAAFHALNLVLHIANVCLMLALGRRLNFHPVPVFFATAIWALHPVHVEAVTYMSASADVLYSFFCLCGLIVLLPDFSARRIALATAFMTLALLSKESAIIFPLLAMGLIHFTQEKKHEARTYFYLWPLALVAALYVIAHFLMLHWLALTPPQAAAPSANFAPFATLPLYARLLVWPTHLYMEHDVAASSIINIVLGLGLTVACAIQIIKAQPSKQSALGWGLLWFFSALLPVFYVDTLAYEHWLYLPTVGLFLGVAQMIASFLAGKKITKSTQIAGGFAVICATAILGFLTYQQNTFWSDPIVFYNRIIQEKVFAPKAHANLGAFYTTHGDAEKALQEYEIAIKESGDTQAETQNNFALTLLSMSEADHSEDALKHFQRALAIDPNLYGALNNIAHFYSRRGDTEQAEFYRAKADTMRRRYQTLPAELKSE